MISSHGAKFQASPTGTHLSEPHGMPIAIVSDIHGNLPALQAVLADLRETAPDLIVHGGDLAFGGAHPAEVVDEIRSLGWAGARGNTDEMLHSPQRLAEFADVIPAIATIAGQGAGHHSTDRSRLGRRSPSLA
jgi:3',5'-cyclic AMP phosphodiesterase CpdA